MERLTKWEDDSITYNEKREFECGEYCDSCSQGAGICKTVENMIKKLATYEDLEEQGLLVRLPCKVGDTVYVPTRNFISELRIIMISVDMHGTYFGWRLNSGIYPNLVGFSVSKLGKTVFLTREEAEKKLEEMKK
mgnify:CR=1 FL=1